MWSMLPVSTRVTAAVILTAVVVSIRLAFSTQPRTLFEFLELLLSSAGIAASIGVLIGRLKLAWRIPCWFGLSRWYPDLNGPWRGLAAPHHSTTRERIEIEMNIDQRWTGIAVITRSLESPLSSRSVLAAPLREENAPVLWTNFLAEQSSPESSDERRWHGSSRLAFDRETGELKGIYWTDRASHIMGHGGTAGSLLLKRSRQTRPR